MRFCLNTDCLGYMPFEEMLDTVALERLRQLARSVPWKRETHQELWTSLVPAHARNQLAPQHREVVERPSRSEDRYDVPASVVDRCNNTDLNY